MLNDSTSCHQLVEKIRVGKFQALPENGETKMYSAPSLTFLPLPKGHCWWEALLVDPGSIHSELTLHRCDP